MLSRGGLGNHIPGLHSWIPQGPSWVALGGEGGNGQRRRMGRVGLGAGEVTGKDWGVASWILVKGDSECCELHLNIF